MFVTIAVSSLTFQYIPTLLDYPLLDFMGIVYLLSITLSLEQQRN
jgi:hypothetical protein